MMRKLLISQHRNWIILSGLGLGYGIWLLLFQFHFLHFLPPCLIQWSLRMECFACGTNRALLALIQGDFGASWQSNPTGIFVGLFFLMYLLKPLYTRHYEH